MSSFNRIGKKWSINEVLALQREYQLLGWSIEKIAEKHKRTARAIEFKIKEEHFDEEDYEEYFGIYYEKTRDKNNEEEREEPKKIKNWTENIMELISLNPTMEIIDDIKPYVKKYNTSINYTQPIKYENSIKNSKNHEGLETYFTEDDETEDDERENKEPEKEDIEKIKKLWNDMKKSWTDMENLMENIIKKNG